MPTDIPDQFSTILILEDNDRIRQAFRKKLSHLSITFAATSDEAIQLLRKHSYNIVSITQDLGGRSKVVPGDPNCGYKVAEFLSQRSGGVSIRTAAEALGVSETTVRRRIKDGKIASKKEDGRVVVLLGEPKTMHLVYHGSRATAYKQLQKILPDIEFRPNWWE